MLSRSRSIWLFLAPGFLLIALLALPLVALVWKTASQDFIAYAFSPNALLALRLSLLTSSLSVGFAILTGTPLAYGMARWKFKGRTWLELLIDLPVVLPPSVAGLGLLIAFGRQGLFGGPLNAIGVSLPFTTVAVVMAQSFVSAPLYVRAARIGFAEIDHQLEESAFVEGANYWQLFYYIMLPLARRALISGAILCWARALGEFGATILFAGNLEGRTQTMPLAIYLSLERGLGTALALSLILICVSVIILALMRYLDQQH